MFSEYRRFRYGLVITLALIIAATAARDVSAGAVTPLVTQQPVAQQIAPPATPLGPVVVTPCRFIDAAGCIPVASQFVRDPAVAPFPFVRTFTGPRARAVIAATCSIAACPGLYPPYARDVAVDGAAGP